MERISKAFDFAFKKHKGQIRKVSKIPFIYHPISVANILLRNKQSIEVICAGFLHDTIEDTDTTFDEIKDIFGEHIAQLVNCVTEPEFNEPKHETWKARKHNTIETTKIATKEVKMLKLADKLANVTDITHDFQLHSHDMWKHFNGDFADQKWYYMSMLDSFKIGESVEQTEMFKDFQNTVNNFFK